MESTEANREEPAADRGAQGVGEAAAPATRRRKKACAIMSDVEKKKMVRSANIMARPRAPARRPSG